MIRVLVVEDDFRVANVHVAFTHRVPGFHVVGTALTAADARRMIAEHRPDLMLLDTYLPDGSGLTVLAETDVDTIMLTAASDAATVRAAYARGALNYLVKPFTGEQLVDRLTAYGRYRNSLATASRTHLSQEDIDRALRHLHTGDRPAMPKGQSAVTARLVAEPAASLTGPVADGGRDRGGTRHRQGHRAALSCRAGAGWIDHHDPALRLHRPPGASLLLEVTRSGRFSPHGLRRGFGWFVITIGAGVLAEQLVDQRSLRRRVTSAAYS
jgi:two-component system CitB family response regulator